MHPNFNRLLIALLTGAMLISCDDNTAPPCSDGARRCQPDGFPMTSTIEACRNGNWEVNEQCSTYNWCVEDSQGHAGCVHQDPGPDIDTAQTDDDTLTPDE